MSDTSGLPEHIRYDHGTEFVSRAVREWLAWMGVTIFIDPVSPWDNGYNESFNGKLRDELLKGVFTQITPNRKRI